MFSAQVKERLDVGLQSVSEVAARLKETPLPVIGPTGQFCAANTNIRQVNGYQVSNQFLNDTIEFQMDLIVASMACGFRSTASLAMTGGASRITFPFLRFNNRTSNATHHAISHRGEPANMSRFDAFGFHTEITNYFL